MGEHCSRLKPFTSPTVEPLDRVLGAGRHLLVLINDILDLSKIEAGRMELHLELFPLAPLIEDVAKTIEPMATKNGSEQPDLILMDLTLPDMDGEEATRRLKSDPATKGIPVILLSRRMP